MNRWLEAGRRPGAASSDWPASGRIVLAVLIGGALVGLGLSRSPAIVTAGTLLGIVLAISVYVRTRLPRIFLRYLVFLLAGYAFLGRGFAYIGVPPLFVGEIGLALGLLAILLTGGFRPIRTSAGTWLILAFAAWSAICTVPYIAEYGQAALRDAVLWGYAAFALIVSTAILRTGWLERVPTVYARILPWFVAYVPIACVVWYTSMDVLPVVPGTDVAIMTFKSGDMLVLLGGIAVFLLVGLYDVYRSRLSKMEKGGSWILWSLWLAGFLLASLQNRGGMLSVFAAVGIVMLLRPRLSVAKSVLVAAMGLSLVLLLNVRFDYGGDQEFSADQIVTNIQSIVAEQSDDGLGATRNWRLLWWEEIIDYTIEGPYFWMGKGYGINLADSDGFQTNIDSSLRSPHNGHLTVLARSGVPGLLLWIALQAWFGVSLIRAYLRARGTGQSQWARINLWILAFWLAAMVNASFDVYLEGPMGGIWFWSLFGIGMACLELQRPDRHLTRVRRVPKQSSKAWVAG